MTKQEAKQTVSPALLEAQARLLDVRSKLGVKPVYPVDTTGPWPDANHWSVAPRDSNRLITGRHPYTYANLPEHLGWGSRRQAKHVRQALINRRQHRNGASCIGSDWPGEQLSCQPPTPTHSSNEQSKPASSIGPDLIDGTWPAPSHKEAEYGSVRLQPAISVGILRAKLAAPGRIWLLLRWIDRAGSGWVEVKHARHLFCEQESAVKVCGWRQLRSLLARGEGIFWSQTNGRIWLHSVPKVARNLHVERLSGHPVDLPVRTLIGGIGQVRAHLYASFHSSRDHANPISRAALSRISQVSPRSQQNYDKRAKVRKQKNYAIGSKLADDNAQDQGWRHGSACFNWHDHKGTFSITKERRLAWQLPNSYIGPHERRPRGRQRQLNRHLAVLSTKGMTGNDQIIGHEQSKRYFDDAAEAIHYLDQQQTGVYWRGGNPGQWHFWDSKRPA